MKTIKIRQARRAGHWRREDELISDEPQWTSSHGRAGLDYRQELTYNSSVPIKDVAWKTCRERYTIEMSGERGLGKSVLAARYDDYDDNDDECRNKNLY